MAAAKPAGGLELPALNIQRIDVPIIGDSPLIVNKWSEKAKAEMLASHMKKAKGPKEAKDPWMDFVNSLYWLSDLPEGRPSEADVEAARFGFPAVAFKSAAITAVTSIGSVTKVMARQCFHIIGEFVEILGPPPANRQDMVRVGMGKPDIRFRGEFSPWGAIIPIRYNASVMSAEQVTSLVQFGGFGVGVGEWRAEKDGVNGLYHVAAMGEKLPCR